MDSTLTALRDSERLYRSLFDSISELVFSLDADGRVLTINRKPLLRLGWEPETLIGQPLEGFVGPKDRHQVRAEFLPAVMADGQAHAVLTLVGGDGVERIFDFRASRLAGGSNHLATVVGSAHDITERVRAEEDLRDLEEELTHSRKMEAVGTLASGVAHDFNNLLQAITGHAQLAQRNERSGRPTGRHLDQVLAAAERAASLVKNLLVFSRGESPELGPLDLNRRIRETLPLLEHTIPKMVRLQPDLAEGIGPVHGNGTQFDQLLLNLVTNARDSMPEGGELGIRTRSTHLNESFCRTHEHLRPGPFVHLSVSDTGCGIGTETRSHIFDPFFTTKEVGKGTGLGLSTAYGIARGHGGLITCESRLGVGTTFHVYLPITDASPPVEELEIGGRSMRDVNKTVLVVDDEESVRQMAREHLESEGYRVLVADCGEQALELCGNGTRADVVVLDLGMPGMGGRRCLQLLLERNPGLKVLVATGYADQEESAAALSGGAAAFLAKPYSLAELGVRLFEVLEGAK
jgi:PAS domain S-box-containing protein